MRRKGDDELVQGSRSSHELTIPPTGIAEEVQG